MEDSVQQSAGLNKKDETHAPVGRPSLRDNRFRVCRKLSRGTKRRGGATGGGAIRGRGLGWAGTWRRGKRHNWTGPSRGGARASASMPLRCQSLEGLDCFFCACLLVSFFFFLNDT